MHRARKVFGTLLDNMEKALEAAAPGAPRFGSFAIPSEAAEALARFPVKVPIDHEYMGSVASDRFREWVAGFVERVTATKADRDLVRHIASLARDFCAAQGKTHALVHLRARFPNKRYSRGRWHKDGIYWAGEHCKKMVVALRGPGTLMGRLVGEYPRGGIGNKKERETHQAEVNSATKLVRALEQGEAGVYTVGGGDRANMHSEPDMSTSRRVFLAVLPGDKEQVAERRKKAKA